MNVAKWAVAGTVAASSLLSLAAGYTPTPQDHELLGKILDRVETLYLHDTARLVDLYEAFPPILAKYQVRPQYDYILGRLYDHLKLVLFTSVYGDQTVCLMPYVQEGDTVEMNYSLATQEGTVVKTTWKNLALAAGMSETGTYLPLVFNAGKGQVLEGFDDEVLGRKQGEKTSFMMSPDKGFGEWQAELLKIVARGPLEQETGPLTPGEDYTVTVSLVRDEETLLAVGRIIDITSGTVTIDFNHPYAGKALLGTIQVEDLFKQCTLEKNPPFKKPISSDGQDDGSATGTVWTRDGLK